MSRTRSLNLPRGRYFNTQYTAVTGYEPTTVELETDLRRVETITDEVNTDRRALKGLRRALRRGIRDPRARATANRIHDWLLNRDLGGPLLLKRNTWADENMPWVYTQGRWTSAVQESMTGHILPSPEVRDKIPYLSPVSSGVLFTAGGTAISRCRPKGSDLQGGVFLGEMREGLPRISGLPIMHKGLNPKAVAEEYLNYEFGIKPLIADINDAVTAFEQADALWAQVERDAGRHIRRRYSFPQVESVSEATPVNSYGYPTGSTYLYSKPGKLHVSTKLVSNTWFSGCFRYALPTGKSPWDRFRKEARRWRAVYGIDMSPETLYNLAPWSWLIDWFVDLQPLMGWLSTTLLDEMAMQYGYIMCHQREEKTYNLLGLKLKSGVVVDPRLMRVRETKQRAAASPYGFGIDWDVFTPRQCAILTALGITRTGK